MNDWIKQIDDNTQAFNQYFGDLTEEQLNWKSDSKTWSIAQNIDHLIVINSTYFPILSDLKSGNYRLPFLAKFGFLVTFFGKIILNSVQADRKKKIKTFPIWEPGTSQIPGDIMQKFAQHHVQLKQEMEAARDWIEMGAVISSPANKNIFYKLETAFEIMVTHERRHLEQSKEVLSQLQAKQAHQH